MEFQDKTLQCVDCGTDFVWTAGEQAFFADKGFKNEPKRCKACKARRATQAPFQPGPRERVETVAVCAVCGKETTVPFKPTQGRPVLCRECFQQRKTAAAGGF
jgi:CxxC-x17-CxxC domain-containing protein